MKVCSHLCQAMDSSGYACNELAIGRFVHSGDPESDAYIYIPWVYIWLCRGCAHILGYDKTIINEYPILDKPAPKLKSEVDRQYDSPDFSNNRRKWRE